MALTIMSFGQVFGIPDDVDMILDCRLLDLRWAFTREQFKCITGTMPDVQRAVRLDPKYAELIKYGQTILWQVSLRKDFKLGVMCTHGHHRSVAIAEELRTHYAYEFVKTPVLYHRDIDRAY